MSILKDDIILFVQIKMQNEFSFKCEMDKWDSAKSRFYFKDEIPTGKQLLYFLLYLVGYLFYFIIV